MNKPSERIVVFVTPAQKRAISATADELGISISELMRRAVMAFSATSDQVKAASIVDRLNAPRQPDALAQVLQKAAKPLRAGRTARPSALANTAAANLDEAHAPDAEAASPAHASANDAANESDDDLAAETRVSSASREIAQAVARLNAQAGTHAENAPVDADRGAVQAAPQAAAPVEPLPPPGPAGFLRRRRDIDIRDDDACSDDAAPEGGKFA